MPVPGPVGKQPIVSLQDSSGALQESTGNTSSGVETVTSSGLTKSLHSSASQVNIDQGQLLIFTMCDERKKVRASVSLLRKEGASMMASTKRTSISFATVTVVESYPGHNNGNTQNTRQRRVSAVASRPSPLLRDISLRNTAAIPHAVAPQPHSSMLDILNNPRLSKEFVRYVLYQSGKIMWRIDFHGSLRLFWMERLDCMRMFMFYVHRVCKCSASTTTATSSQYCSQ